MLSGVLLIADAGITLGWQEPVSSFAASRQQSELGKALEHPSKRILLKEPLPGDAIGKIELPSLGRHYFVVEGDDGASLRKGPGHYPDTPLPGERGTVAIAGHRTTHGAPFRTIDRLHRGNKIVLSMPYGRFTYTVTKTKIVDPTDVGVKKNVGYNQLILSACHPLYSAAQRVVVFARQTARAKPDVEGRLQRTHQAGRRSAQANGAAMDEPSTFASSRDSKNITSATSRATDTTITASQ
jgi:sortase A